MDRHCNHYIPPACQEGGIINVALRNQTLPLKGLIPLQPVEPCTFGDQCGHMVYIGHNFYGDKPLLIHNLLLFLKHPTSNHNQYYFLFFWITTQWQIWLQIYLNINSWQYTHPNMVINWLSFITSMATVEEELLTTHNTKICWKKFLPKHKFLTICTSINVNPMSFI